MTLPGWRGHLVALGFDQDQVQYGFLPADWDAVYPASDEWKKLLLALAQREAARDTDPGKIIAKTAIAESQRDQALANLNDIKQKLSLAIVAHARRTRATRETCAEASGWSDPR